MYEENELIFVIEKEYQMYQIEQLKYFLKETDLEGQYGRINRSFI